MKKMFFLCLCGMGFMLEGVDVENARCKNIEAAIAQFSSTLTNNIESMDYDFMSILGEIEDMKSEVDSTNLLSKLAKGLCVISKDIWKYKDSEIFQWKRVYLMERAMSIDVMSDSGSVLAKLEKHLDLLRAMREELALYEDAESPEVYRKLWFKRKREYSARQVGQSGTNRNIKIKGTLPLDERPSRKWGYKKDIEYQISRYEKRYFDSLVLQDDYRKLPKEEQKILIEMVREGLGRYPEWYRKELEGKK